MSNVYQPKRKEMAHVRVVSAETYRNNRGGLKQVGCVQRGYTAFVTTQKNKQSGLCSFVDDTASLTKKAKSELVRFFSAKSNKKKDVAYLVVPKTKIKKNK